MAQSIGIGNDIDPSAQVGPGVKLGSYNRIGPGVVIGSLNALHEAKITIGDCNVINDGTRILGGEGGVVIGDWNVFHNSMLVMGEGPMDIGSNCWFGQNTILDSAGGLSVGNGVRVGMYSQIWTHVASGELIEGCTLFASQPTRIEDDVWLVGSCIVGSGLTLSRRAICLIGSLLTKDAEPGRVYGGAPAKLLEKLDFWKEVTMSEKFEMMSVWVDEFVSSYESRLAVRRDPAQESLEVLSSETSERLVITTGSRPDPDASLTTTLFDLSNKRYTKTLSHLERNFYRYLYNHKARFLPFQSDLGLS